MIPLAATAASAVGGTAIKALSGNLQDFLGLLMTQLRNQDPTSPLDTNQFTSQLVQFASVEQQIGSNTNLTKLIELTQGNAMMQSSSLVGKAVQVASDRLVLQGGRAAVRFESRDIGAVKVSVLNDAGAVVREATAPSKPGVNVWTWDGRDTAGGQLPDGSYRVAVSGARMGGPEEAVPFSVLATATGVQRSAGGVKLQLGSLAVDMSAIQSVGQ